MTEDEERACLIAEAKAWLNTPYHHAARIRGVGVDCAYFLADVGHAALPERVPKIAPASYPSDWHMHQETTLYVDWLSQITKPLPGKAEKGVWTGTKPKPGDVAMYKFGRAVAHGAFIIDWDQALLIHAYLDSGVVYQNANADWLFKRLDSIWTLWPPA